MDEDGKGDEVRGGKGDDDGGRERSCVKGVGGYVVVVGGGWGGGDFSA